MIQRACAFWTVFACLAACGCGYGGGTHDTGLALTASVVSEMTAVSSAAKAQDDLTLFDPASRTVRLQGACNETLSFQLVVDAGAEPINGLRVALADLDGPERAKIASANIRVFRLWPLKAPEYPAWYVRLADSSATAAPAQNTFFYDAMVPLNAPRNGQPFDVPAGGRAALWVDLYIPRQAAPGDYTSRVMLTSQTHRDWTAGLALRVHDLVLPDERPFCAAGAFDHGALIRAMMRRDGRPFDPPHLDRSDPMVRNALVLMRQLMALAHEHRLDLFDSALRPLLKRDLDGAVKLDWEDYDAIAGPYINGSAFDDGIGVPVWPLPQCENWPGSENYGGGDSVQYRDVFKDVSAQSREHMAGKLGASKALVAWLCRDAGATPDAYERQVALAKTLRLGDTETPILTRLPRVLPDAAVPAEFDALGGISAPPGELFATPGGTGAAGAWFSPGLPPYAPGLGLLARPADVRALPWLTMKYRCGGMFIPDVLDWPRDDGPPDQWPAAEAAQTRLFYPGTIAGLDEVLPSVRLKRLRRGLQDAAYLNLLRQRGAGEQADEIIAAMVRYAGLQSGGDCYADARLDGWTHDDRAWEPARRLLVQEVLGVIRPTPQPTLELLAQRVAWKDYLARTRQARIERIRSRVDLSGQPPAMRATVLLDVFNPGIAASRVRAELVQLPAGWTPRPPPAADTNPDRPADTNPDRPAGRAEQIVLQPGQSGTLTLVAFGPPGATGQAGHLRVSVALSVDGGAPTTVQCPVPLVRAAVMRQPPRIDGAFDDWPSSGAATAGDFGLLGRRGLPAGDQPVAQPARQTTVYVARDEANLYLGFRCQEPRPDRMTVKFDNLVRCEQLLAGGEDLVEVLLDPGRQAKGPEDLYHVVVKPGGAVIAERGAPGSARPWAAHVRAAVRVIQPVGAMAAGASAPAADGAWLVELAIPLADLGPGAKETLWGANFMRFAAQDNESSSWSRTPRHYYDPMNLGTMLVERP